MSLFNLHRRVKTNCIAFTVANDGNKTIGINTRLAFKNFAVVLNGQLLGGGAAFA